MVSFSTTTALGWVPVGRLLCPTVLCGGVPMTTFGGRHRSSAGIWRRRSSVAVNLSSSASGFTIAGDCRRQGLKLVSNAGCSVQCGRRVRDRRWRIVNVNDVVDNGLLSTRRRRGRTSLGPCLLMRPYAEPWGARRSIVRRTDSKRTNGSWHNLPHHCMQRLHGMRLEWRSP